MTSTSHAPVQAFIWAAAGAFLMVLADFFVKKLAVSGVGMGALFFFAFPSGAFVLVVLSKFRGGIRHHLFPKHPKLLLTRGLFLVMAGYLLFNSLLNNPFSQHIMITQLAPIFTLIFSVAFLKEVLIKQLYTIIILCIFGLWLIVDPSFSTVSPFLLLALGTAIVQGASHTFVAGNSHRITPIGFTFWGTGLLALVGGILWFLFDRKVPDFETLAWIQLTSLLACVGLAMIAHGLQQARPNVGQVGVMLYIQTPAAIILGWVFFSEVPSLASLAGGSLIVGSGVYLALLKSNKKNVMNKEI